MTRAVPAHARADPAEPSEAPAPPNARWFAGLALGLGVGHAVVSAYWALGGEALLDTVGGEIERLGRERSTSVLVGLWVTVALKLVGATLGLAVVRRWGRGGVRRLVALAAWAAAAILTLYGGLLTIGGILVVHDVIQAAPDADRHALRWHAWLWDPWFGLWGLALLAALVTDRRSRRGP